MRKIRFRGKATLSAYKLDRMQIEHEKGWVFGSLITNAGCPFIVGEIAERGEEYIQLEWWVAVDPETVGQFIDAVDVTGAELFEGDVLAHDDGDWSFTARVAHGGYEWYLEGISVNDSLSFDDFYIDGYVDAKKIGNIHDNPELLEVPE